MTVERAKLAPAPDPGKPVRAAAAFLALCPAGGLLGLDPGSRRIGVAGSDDGRLIATPLLTLHRQGRARDMERLRVLARTRRAAGIVLGYPLAMDGGEGPAARRARRLGGELMRALGLPLLLWDERLSTFEAGEILAERGRHRRAGRTAGIDAIAASVILRDALAALR